jgi:radical SAM superfamily enzyme YgiQ (UPF0313 family)
VNALRVTLVSSLGVSRLTSPDIPDSYEPPLGVLTLAAQLRELFPVGFVDLDHLWRLHGSDPAQFQRIAVEQIVATRPDVLGFSSISGSYPLTIRLAERCSHLLPETTVILGGPQATVTDIATLNVFPFIDLILRGEADDTLPALVRAIASHSPISTIPALTFRDRRQIRRNPNGPPVLDMDSLPLPAFDLVPGMRELPAIPLEIGRGCPFSCTFCSTNDFFRRRFRLKSPAHTLDEMHSLHRKWGIGSFQLVHDMFTVDRRRVIVFCETLIAAGSPYRWSTSARTDSVDADLLRTMRSAGCDGIFFGIETGSQRMQRVIDKDLDLAQARTVLRETNALRIHTDVSLIAGYPQEAKEDLRATVHFFGEAMLLPWIDPQLHMLSPLAGTPLTLGYQDRITLDENWETISENGTLQDPVDRLMIAAHPEIFPNFYAFPYYTGRGVLRRLRDFLFCGLARCGGLMRALYLEVGDLLTVFEEWDQTYSTRPTEWFRSSEFVGHLISFSVTRYPSRPSILATAEFYKRAFATVMLRSPKPTAWQPYVTLAPNAMLVESGCDINSVLKALSQGKQPEDEVCTTETTVAVKLVAGNRAEILRFPPLTLELLRHAEKQSDVEEIVCDFERRDIGVPGLATRSVVQGGIEYLERSGFVRLVVPVREGATRNPTRWSGKGSHDPVFARVPGQTHLV